MFLSLQLQEWCLGGNIINSTILVYDYNPSKIIIRDMLRDYVVLVDIKWLFSVLGFVPDFLMNSKSIFKLLY